MIRIGLMRGIVPDFLFVIKHPLLLLTSRSITNQRKLPPNFKVLNPLQLSASNPLSLRGGITKTFENRYIRIHQFNACFHSFRLIFQRKNMHIVYQQFFYTSLIIRGTNTLLNPEVSSSLQTLKGFLILIIRTRD